MVLFAPERTGSRTAQAILNFYGFQSNRPGSSNKTIFEYTHDCKILDGFENYKIICTARNPYGRILSIFTSFKQISVNRFHGIQEFEDFLLRDINLTHWTKIICNPLLEKKPDYILRLEYLKHDYENLPFIYDVIDEKKLDKMLSHGKEPNNWEEVYTQQMKEIVYQKCKNHFEFWGYEK